MQAQTTKLVVAAGSTPGAGMKIGNSTISIKPATGDGVKSVVVTANEPPPLAPLSVQVNKQTKTITITPNAADGKVLVSPSQKITANKMLVDLLDKKVLEPPVFASIKRKIDMDSEVSAKKADTEGGDQASSKVATCTQKLQAQLSTFSRPTTTLIRLQRR
jgi:hypothetical protein